MSVVLKLARRHLRRRPGRSLLTMLGVASATVLVVGVEALSAGLEQAVAGSEAARTLVVYRENRYCPQTSFLPERYAASIRDLPGVASVLPVKVYLSNCRTSLDAVAFQGAPAADVLAARDVRVLAGDAGRFLSEAQSALIGREFAARRGLGPGDRFRFGEITVDVAGVFASDDPLNESLILTHLEFLQRSGPVSRLGTVTQFEVLVDDAQAAPRVAQEIDSLFRTAEEPTDTRSKAEFLVDATRELRELLAFGRIFGLVAGVVVLVLVANTVVLAMQERRREFGVYLALGYGGRHLAALVLAETVFLTLTGALVGLAVAFVLIRSSHLAIAVEGVTVRFALAPAAFGRALAAACGAALLAALLPALRAARSDVRSLLKSA